MSQRRSNHRQGRHRKAELKSVPIVSPVLLQLAERALPAAVVVGAVALK